MSYGKKQTVQEATEIAAKSGVTLFKIGDKVRTNHGNEGVIIDIDAYGNGYGKLFWNISCYVVSASAFGLMRVDFIDAHSTLGGCLKKID
jgi:hypothetical protein